MITVASDEKKYVINEFRKHIKALHVEHLELGDIIVNNFIIERKTIDDLIHSVINGRLFRQLTNIKAFAERFDAVGILVIEGTSPSIRNKKYLKYMSINDIIVNTLAAFNITPIRTKNITETAKFINNLDIYNSKKKAIIKEVRGFKRRRTLMDRKKYALMGFPAIGDKRSNEILKRFGTLNEYFKWVKKNKKGTSIYSVLME